MTLGLVNLAQGGFKVGCSSNNVIWIYGVVAPSREVPARLGGGLFSSGGLGLRLGLKTQQSSKRRF